MWLNWHQLAKMTNKEEKFTKRYVFWNKNGSFWDLNGLKLTKKIEMS